MSCHTNELVATLSERLLAPPEGQAGSPHEEAESGLVDAVRGFPSTAMMSASKPASIFPRSGVPNSSAFTMVAERIAWIGD